MPLSRPDTMGIRLRPTDRMEHLRGHLCRPGRQRRLRLVLLCHRGVRLVSQALPSRQEDLLKRRLRRRTDSAEETLQTL